MGEARKTEMVPSLATRNKNQRLLRVVIPAMNEEERIAESLAAYCEHFRETATILVVANGCTDRTPDVVRQMAGRYSNLQLLVVAAPLGKGGAVRAGLTIGTEPYVAFVDADGSARPDQLDLLLQACRSQEVSGAIGSRWLRGSIIARKQPLRRRLASRAFNVLVRLLFGLRYTDTQCGVKLFERSAINEVLGRLEIANFAFDVDLLVALKRLAFPIIEVPITWGDVPEYSKVMVVRAGYSMFWALMRLRIRDGFLGRLPWTDLLARSSMIPVKRGVRFLIVTSGAPLSSVEQRLLDEVKAQGHEYHIERLTTIAKKLRFAWGYVRSGHHSYEVIVDLLKHNGSVFSNFSTKPKLRPASLAALGPQAIASLVESSAKRCGYHAFFWRYDEGWALSSPAETLLRESL